MHIQPTTPVGKRIASPLLRSPQPHDSLLDQLHFFLFKLVIVKLLEANTKCAHNQRTSHFESFLRTIHDIPILPILHVCSPLQAYRSGHQNTESDILSRVCVHVVFESKKHEHGRLIIGISLMLALHKVSS